MKKLLVTGSSGLIGSEVVRHFDKLGYKIYGVDNNNVDISRIPNSYSGLTIIVSINTMQELLLEISNDFSSIVSMITQESIHLNKKLAKINVEQAVKSQKNAIVEEAIQQQGVSVDFYA